MGGPLSSLLADIFMDRLEQWILKFGRHSSKALLWYRFVDDIFCIWTGTDSELALFTHDLHSFDEKLSFSVTDSSHAANYLDVSISLVQDDIDDNSLTPKFAIYRKPQYTGVNKFVRALVLQALQNAPERALEQTY